MGRIRPRNIAGGAYRGLAAEILRLAFLDMKKNREDRVLRSGIARKISTRKATVWLGSQAATRWFDAVDIDQSRALQASGWVDVARGLLKNGDLSAPERELLHRGIEYMEDVCGTS